MRRSRGGGGRSRGGGGGRHSSERLKAVRFLNEQLATTSPSGLVAIQKIGVLQGFLNNGMRRKVWPVLLGIAETGGRVKEVATGQHRDSSQIELDVKRSLWKLPGDIDDEARDLLRLELSRVIHFALQEVPHHRPPPSPFAPSALPFPPLTSAPNPSTSSTHANAHMVRHCHGHALFRSCD